MTFRFAGNRLLTLLFFLSIANAGFGCHMSKRKKREVQGHNDLYSQKYMSACLEVEANFRDFDWLSNIQYTFDHSNWYLGTRDVLCGLESGYDNAVCWRQEVEQYVGNNKLLPIVKRCIGKLFSDVARGVYTYASRTKRELQEPQSYSGLEDVNSNYVKCVERGSSLDLAKLIPVIAATTVVRKDDSSLSYRPITYAQKLLYLTRSGSRLRQSIQICNQRHFPAPNFWTEWSPLSHCLPGCNGRRTKTRTCRSGDAPKVILRDSQCSGSAKQTRRCYGDSCWGGWSNWGDCSKTCRWGIRVRRRSCRSSSSYRYGYGYPNGPGQASCYGKTTERGSCNIHTECERGGYNY